MAMLWYKQMERWMPPWLAQPAEIHSQVYQLPSGWENQNQGSKTFKTG